MKSVKFMLETLKRKFIFWLAVCRSFDNTVDLDKNKQRSSFWRTYKSWRFKDREPLELVKVFRLHATFHNATGYLKTNPKIGPGYCYMVLFLNSKLNFCFLGHISSIMLFSENVTTVPFNQSVNH